VAQSFGIQTLRLVPGERRNTADPQSGTALTNFNNKEDNIKRNIARRTLVILSINALCLGLAIAGRAQEDPGRPAAKAAGDWGFTLMANGSRGKVEFNPTSLNFGYLEVVFGNSKTLATTLTNSGSTTLRITGITAGPNPPFSETNTCGSSVGPGESCVIDVTFRPWSSGSFSGAVWVYDNGGGGAQEVPLSGHGFPRL
jgi:HYDIN/CFA65/VesB family protein